MISTHVLDTSLGSPAAGVVVHLEKQLGAGWSKLARETTNNDGRIVFNSPAETGVYRLQFQVEDYFRKHKISAFFPSVPVIFSIRDTQRKYHVPLLLNPYGYSTYRGS